MTLPDALVAENVRLNASLDAAVRRAAAQQERADRLGWAMESIAHPEAETLNWSFDARYYQAQGLAREALRPSRAAELADVAFGMETKP